MLYLTNGNGKNQQALKLSRVGFTRVNKYSKPT